jgi:hypothetical protein
VRPAAAVIPTSTTPAGAQLEHDVRNDRPTLKEQPAPSSSTPSDCPKGTWNRLGKAALAASRGEPVHQIDWRLVGPRRKRLVLHSPIALMVCWIVAYPRGLANENKHYQP